MKAFLLLAVVVVARATVVPVAPVGVEEGASAQFRSEDNLGNYNFGYNEDHTSGGSFRREAGDAHGNVAGSYGLRDADGRVRIVNYIANDDGFHADIKTNEPGVEPKDTADATFNKAVETVVVQAAVPAPVVAIPEPVAIRTEQVAVASPVFPPAPYVAPVKSSETAVYSFPEPAAVPVAKTHQTTITETKPIPYAFPAPAAVPVAKSIAAPIAYAAAPAPIAYAAAPVAKATTTTITQTHPVSYAFPAPAAVPVAKSSTTTFTQSAPALIGAYATPIAAKTIATTKVAVAEPAPISYAFPAQAAVPVAKSSTTTFTQSSPALVGAYATPIAAKTIATTKVAVAEPAPISYAFPAPAAVPVAKSSTTTITQSGPAAYAFPAPAAVPVAKSSTTTITQAAPAVAIAEPVSYAFPAPAAVPVAKSIATAPAIAVAETAPIAYNTFPSSTGYVAKTGYAPSSAFTYAPRYALNSYLNGLQYGGPFYRSIYSPVVASFAGPVPYFSNIEYHGYPVLKK